MAVVSDQALAIGVTAVPNPDADRHSDLWFVFEELMGEFAFITGTGFDPVGGIMKEYDSRAMRKVEDGEDVSIVVQASAVSAGITIAKTGRMLIKLH